jgi:methionyl-tRNA formyltransferase
MADGLNIAFAGTPDLAAKILEFIYKSKCHTVCAVFTQPDRPSGRGKKIRKSPVKLMAESLDIPTYQPQSKIELEKESLLSEVDVMVVAAYGLILTNKTLLRLRHGCINVHMSLLPRWRGAAPIQQAILAGDNVTGVTIMQMDSGLDTGDILHQEQCSIDKKDTAGSLHEKLCCLGSETILTVLNRLAENDIHPVPQENNFATYAGKISKADALVDWTKSAVEIERQIRAMNPVPVAYTILEERPVRLWEAEIVETEYESNPPGTIVSFSSRGIEVATADKNINIIKMQLPGKKVMGAKDFYNGNPALWTGLAG